MTEDKELQEAAVKYATQPGINGEVYMHDSLRMAYIAGHSSRDGEVGELKKEANQLKEKLWVIHFEISSLNLSVIDTTDEFQTILYKIKLFTENYFNENLRQTKLKGGR